MFASALKLKMREQYVARKLPNDLQQRENAAFVLGVGRDGIVLDPRFCFSPHFFTKVVSARDATLKTFFEDDMTNTISILFLILGLFGFAILTGTSAKAQQPGIVSAGYAMADTVVKVPIDSEPPSMPLTSAQIIAAFLKTEAATREALNQHTCKREVILETIGPNGEVTGQYIRQSQFIFDDKGNRIERVLYHPASTITQLRITKEDIQDLAGAQLLGVDVTEVGKYKLSYAGTDMIGSQRAFIIDVAPVVAPDPQHMKQRYFVGRVWINADNYHLIKVKGVVEPHGKQRFPVFETWRGMVGDLLLPVRTQADDVLHFPRIDVHYRINVRYYDYQRFSSKVVITEVPASE